VKRRKPEHGVDFFHSCENVKGQQYSIGKEWVFSSVSVSFESMADLGFYHRVCHIKIFLCNLIKSFLICKTIFQFGKNHMH
jgi:hypothetical protein